MGDPLRETVRNLNASLKLALKFLSFLFVARERLNEWAASISRSFEEVSIEDKNLIFNLTTWFKREGAFRHAFLKDLITL